MKTTNTINTATLILAAIVTCCSSNAYAQKKQEQQSPETNEKTAETHQEHPRQRPRTAFVKVADFYLRNGQFVFGQLISEDKNKIIVKQLDGSRIVVSTYSKREVDTRTLHIKNVPQFKHYIGLGEYFSGRTWDFRDDTDDFIQAIRCYEKAKQSAIETQRQEDEIEQINKRIEHLEADRQLWIREVESRAKLKKLEFETEIEARLNEFEDRVNTNSRQIDKSTTDVKEGYRKLSERISRINKDVSRQQDQIRTNRKLIDSIDYRIRWYYYPRSYHYPDRRKSKSGDNR